MKLELAETNNGIHYVKSVEFCCHNMSRQICGPHKLFWFKDFEAGVHTHPVEPTLVLTAEPGRVYHGLDRVLCCPYCGAPIVTVKPPRSYDQGDYPARLPLPNNE